VCVAGNRWQRPDTDYEFRIMSASKPSVFTSYPNPKREHGFVHVKSRMTALRAIAAMPFGRLAAPKLLPESTKGRQLR
jgi:hypothetical protein